MVARRGSRACPDRQSAAHRSQLARTAGTGARSVCPNPSHQPRGAWKAPASAGAHAMARACSGAGGLLAPRRSAARNVLRGDRHTFRPATALDARPYPWSCRCACTTAGECAVLRTFARSGGQGSNGTFAAPANFSLASPAAKSPSAVPMASVRSRSRTGFWGGAWGSLRWPSGTLQQLESAV